MTDSKTGLKLTKHTLKSGKIIYISDKCHLTGNRAVFADKDGFWEWGREQSKLKYTKLLQVFKFKTGEHEAETLAIHATKENLEDIISYFRQFETKAQEAVLNGRNGILVDASGMDSGEDFIFVTFGDWLDNDGTGAWFAVKNKEFRKQYEVKEEK